MKDQLIRTIKQLVIQVEGIMLDGQKNACFLPLFSIPPKSTPSQTLRAALTFKSWHPFRQELNTVLLLDSRKATACNSLHLDFYGKQH